MATSLQRPLSRICAILLTCGSYFTSCCGSGRSRVSRLVEREKYVGTLPQYSAMLPSPAEARCSGDVAGVRGHVFMVSTLHQCCVADVAWLKRCARREVAKGGGICTKPLCFLSIWTSQWCTTRFTGFIRVDGSPQESIRQL